MKPKAQEFLNLLLWTTEMATQPTFRNLTESYEAWAYRNGLLRELGVLEKRNLVERDVRAPDERVYRLTEQGRLRALGGRDPQAEWKREWDGLWRLILFDVPSAADTRRQKLRRYLRGQAFGCLQKSVWITPDPLVRERELLAGDKIDVEVLVLWEGRPCAGERDAEIVAGAWDFGRIDRRYAKYLKVLDQRPTGALADDSAAKVFQRWVTAERKAWFDAVSIDPLLPERLLPPGYLGCEAWQRRGAAQAHVREQIGNFGG
jgi:phenylacetic acid degradation operon negative regulatory protein